MGGKIIEPHHRDILVSMIALLDEALRKADEVGLPDVAVKICNALDLADQALKSGQS